MTLDYNAKLSEIQADFNEKVIPVRSALRSALRTDRHLVILEFLITESATSELVRNRGSMWHVVRRRLYFLGLGPFRETPGKFNRCRRIRLFNMFLWHLCFKTFLQTVPL